MEERRHFQRVAFDAPARLGLGDRLVEGRVVDLSFKGALIHLDERCDFEIGTCLELRVSLMTEEVRMTVEVIRHHASELGLRCLTIDLDSMTHIRRLMEFNLADPDLLEREFLAFAS